MPMAMWLCSRSFSRMITPPLSAGPAPLTDGPVVRTPPKASPISADSRSCSRLPAAATMKFEAT